MQRHVTTPDVSGSKTKDKDKAGKAGGKQKDQEDQPQIQDADERLLTDIHAQALAAIDKIVRLVL